MLRHQLAVLRRQVARPRYAPGDPMVLATSASSPSSASGSVSSPSSGGGVPSWSWSSSGRAQMITRQRPVSARDRAASVYSSAASATADVTSALASRRSWRSGISRTSASSKTSSAPKFVSALKPGKGWCRFSWPGLACIASIGDWQRCSHFRRSSTAPGGPSRPTAMVCGAVRVRVGRTVDGDAVARVDVPVARAELQFGLVQDVSLHVVTSQRPVTRVPAWESSGIGSGGGIHARRPHLCRSPASACLVEAAR